LRTSAGNKAWFHLYDPVNQTALAVQRLIDLGAVIIGKTRTSQFANGESPTIDWVDYHDPFNPRADGYQDPSSSSAGAGSAESSYDWIDMNIGSDTGGSIRAPAGVSGVWGNRPSQGAINLTGVISLSPEMDTGAFVARSAKDFAAYGKAWYGGNPMFKSYKSFPSKIIYPIDTIGINSTLYPSPGFFPIADASSQAIYDTFVSKLEIFLSVKKTTYDFYTEYKSTSGTKLYPPDHVGEVWTKLTCYHQARDIWNPFFADYAAANNGDKPHLDPPVKRNYAYGLNQTDADFKRIIAAKGVFEQWVQSKFLISDFASDSCSNAILVNPVVTGASSSRDDVYMKDAPTGANAYLGWNRYGISQLGGVPEVVIPLGSLPFESPVTGTIKQSPVAVSLLAGYGCDFMLYDLVVALAEEGIIPASVKTGANM
jgi:Asp-tRNA(Asn)/Glu-tRNA(Gln) amidotransferase A subunit family amidase